MGALASRRPLLNNMKFHHKDTKAPSRIGHLAVVLLALCLGALVVINPKERPPGRQRSQARPELRRG
jgi:hypothetical protein